MWGYELNESFLDNEFLENFVLNLRLLVIMTHYSL